MVRSAVCRDLLAPDRAGRACVAVKAARAATLNYGVSINTALDFIIVAFAIFMFLKIVNAAERKEETKPAGPAEPPPQERRIGEIRDLLIARAKV